MTGTGGHALVVGGSGMLAGVVHRLTTGHAAVSLLARDPLRCRRVARSAPGPGRVVPVTVDYTDPVGLRAALAEATGRHGRYRLVVAWVRTPHRAAVWQALAGAVAPGALLVDVRSGALVASGRPDPVPALVSGVPDARYRSVGLGFTDDGPGRTRWLTHAEIAGGVLAALADGAPRSSVVGRVEPWHEAP